MPLRDHFRPPVWNLASWEGFHGGWPMVIAMQLNKTLPEGYSLEPRAHLGSTYEIDVCGFESDDVHFPRAFDQDSGGVATATMAPPKPTRVVEVDLTEEYAYEVLIYDHNRGRQLVAAVELVSPGNKDRPDSRRAFVAKCATLLQSRVCVSIVDLVTTRQFNLYCELMELAGRPDPAFLTAAPATYAATCRGRKIHDKAHMEIWAYPLILGQLLPSLPIWLTEDLFITLDLETTYEDTCRTLRIP